MKKNNLVKTIILLVVMQISFYCNISCDDSYSGKEDYCTVYDITTDKVLFVTAWSVTKGDRYHSTSNKLFEVIAVVDKKTAYAKYIKDVEMPNIDSFIRGDIPVVNKLQDTVKVGIYFTHTDESYIPTSGKYSEMGRGDVMEVGEALKERLEDRGTKALVDKTPHDPHDAGAYKRSRRTVTRLLKAGNNLLFDIHRDAVPREEYISEIEGVPTAKVRIVVGRSNINMQVNDEMAKKIKALSDKKYPGLVKDIFYGRGSYNQDLLPRSLLLEFGTYTNSQERATNSTPFMADIITTLISTYGVGERDIEKTTGISEGTGNSLFIVIGLLFGGGLILFFSTSNNQGFKSRLKDFSQELSNFLGRKKKEDKK